MMLTESQQALLAGENGPAAQKAMQILNALGTIYGAQALVPVVSAQISGVSYDNLGEAGLEFLSEMADGGGKTQVLTTLNPAGMDIENWQAMGIPADFAAQQQRVLEAFARMGVVATCSCTPYLTGNLPHLGEHIAWAESSAVCYANSVLGARTNREGGPSALAAALTGLTPAYGLHLDENRLPTVHIHVEAPCQDTVEFGALGKWIGDWLDSHTAGRIPYISGIPAASLECLKSFCASIATYGGVALFHMQGITPEAERFGSISADLPQIAIQEADLANALNEMNDGQPEEVDFVSLGCPHLSIHEIARIAALLQGKQVKKTFWITTARPTKHMADLAGYTKIIEQSGAIFAVDTCCVVAPIRGRFHTLASDSAKACYYAGSKNKFKTVIRSFDEVIAEALR